MSVCFCVVYDTRRRYYTPGCFHVAFLTFCDCCE